MLVYDGGYVKEDRAPSEKCRVRDEGCGGQRCCDMILANVECLAVLEVRNGKARCKGRPASWSKVPSFNTVSSVDV